MIECQKWFDCQSTRNCRKKMAQKRKNTAPWNMSQTAKSIPGLQEEMETSSTPVYSLEDDDPIIPGGPYVSSRIVTRMLYTLATVGFIPFEISLDGLLSLFIRTTSKETKSQNAILFLIKTLIYLLFLLISIPIVLCAFILWCPLQLFRPRSYTYVCPTTHANSVSEYKRIASQEFRSNLPSEAFTAANSNTYTLVTANICLMPEFVAHINNLCNSTTRGEKIAAYFCGHKIQIQPKKTNQKAGERQTETDYLFSPWSSEALNVGNGMHSRDSSITETGSLTSTLWSISSKEQCVCDSFPTPADFLCLQEVFDRRATKQLIKGLQEKYPYIIYDVSWPIHDKRLSILGSGLCIASRYPFIDVEFRAFPDGHSDDKLACKGLLMTKLFLGTGKSGEDLIGFLANTHLQAWSHSSASSVRCKQLNCISMWKQEFYRESRRRSKASKELIMFDIITGDFNFDKISHFDSREQQCHFFRNLVDPCIDTSSGNQYSWVVGTELNQKMMHTDPVSTPQGLQRMMVSELERHQFVASTMSHKTTLPRNGDGKRRIDYILYKPCKEVEMDVKDYKFFTGLATLSDHIPVGMSFSCEPNSS